MAAETVWQLVDDRAKRSPDAVILIDEHGRTVTFGQFRDRALGLAGGALREVPDDSDAVAWIFFTSGSTGAPKGARHTDRSLLVGIPEFARRAELTADDVGIIAFPVAHIGGVLSLVTMLHAGFPAVLVETFSPAAVIGLMRRHQVTFMGGGAPCSEHLYRAVRDELGVTIAHDYNMTESPMITVSSTTDSDDQLAHTEGRPIDGCEVRISPEGEVQVRGPIVCKGYTDGAETAKAFTSDGWFRTGDLGRLRPDGHLEITGRIKDLIIRKGENIAPLEIEELLSARPDIAEAAVIGVPDETAGELVCAVITCRPGVPAPQLADLTAWLRESGLMVQKLPERLHVVEMMPRTATGKFDKPALRAAYS